MTGISSEIEGLDLRSECLGRRDGHASLIFLHVWISGLRMTGVCNDIIQNLGNRIYP